MISLQLGETFSDFKLQRPVQWVLRPPGTTKPSAKIFVPTPLVSKGLLRP